MGDLEMRERGRRRRRKTVSQCPDFPLSFPKRKREGVWKSKTELMRTDGNVYMWVGVL